MRSIIEELLASIEPPILVIEPATNKDTGDAVTLLTFVETEGSCIVWASDEGGDVDDAIADWRDDVTRIVDLRSTGGANA